MASKTPSSWNLPFIYCFRYYILQSHTHNRGIHFFPLFLYWNLTHIAMEHILYFYFIFPFTFFSTPSTTYASCRHPMSIHFFLKFFLGIFKIFHSPSINLPIFIYFSNFYKINKLNPNSDLYFPKEYLNYSKLFNKSKLLVLESYLEQLIFKS